MAKRLRGRVGPLWELHVEMGAKEGRGESQLDR